MKHDQQPSPKNDKSTLSAGDIVDYLLQHPDFFNQNPDVLTEINLSHQCEGAISLMERQVSLLRTQNKQYKQQLETLIDIARENDSLSEHFHNLTLALMDAETINDAFIALDDTLRGQLEVDAVAVKLFINPAEVGLEPENELMQSVFINMSDPRVSEYKTILTQEKPLCGPLKTEQLRYIFGPDSSDIQSTALIPLGGDSCTSLSCPFLGMLAIGSREADRFHANMGTLFLNHLGDIVSRTIKAHLIARPDA